MEKDCSLQVASQIEGIDYMSRAVKSKVKIRALILDALTYGVGGDKKGVGKYANGAIFLLLKKLNTALTYIPDDDYEGIQKIAQVYLKLAQLAIPTQAQEDAIQSGINMLPSQAQQSTLFYDAMERYIRERRLIHANSIPTTARVVESNIIPDIRELAKQELSKRRAESLGTTIAQPESTPPPVTGGKGSLDD